MKLVTRLVKSIRLRLGRQREGNVADMGKSFRRTLLSLAKEMPDEERKQFLDSVTSLSDERLVGECGWLVLQILVKRTVFERFVELGFGSELIYVYAADTPEESAQRVFDFLVLLGQRTEQLPKH